MLRSLHIGSRLAISFSVLLGLLLAVAAVSLSDLKKLTAVTQTIVDVQAQRVALAHAADQHAQSAASHLRQLLHTTEQTERVPLYAMMDAEIAAMDAAVAGMTQPAPAENAPLTRLGELRGYYNTAFHATVEMIEVDGIEAAKDYFEGQTRYALNELLKETSALSVQQQHDMHESLKQLQQAEYDARTLVIALALGAVLTGTLLAWIIARSIVIPVREATRAAEAIAQGDFNHLVPVGHTDEMGQLLKSLAVMRDSIASREAGR